MSIGAGPLPSNFPYGFANGLLVRGVSVLSSTPGQTFWVYNGTNLAPQGRAGSDGNRGTFESPYATIGFAISQCVAGRGDIVMVKPGHSETITAAAGMAFNVAGVAVVGLGSGQLRPTIKFSTATGASLKVTAAQMTLQNFYIDCTGIDALTTPLDIEAADFQMLDCWVLTGNASGQATNVVVTTAAADRMVISGCKFFGTTDAGTATPIKIVGGDSIVIAGNDIQGNYTTSLGGIQNVTTACTNALIKGNYINNRTAASTVAMTFVSTSTGMIADNRMQILSGTAPIVGAGMSWVGGNYYAATIATAGTLI